MDATTSAAADANTTSTAAKSGKLTFKENKVAFLKEKFISFLKMIYNPKKKQLLGKDGEDWFKLSLFYVAFYTAIGAFTWAIMAVFMGINKATNPVIPRYAGKASVLSESVFSPGLSVRPHYSTDAASISISSDPSIYINYMNQFFQPYNESVNQTTVCNSTLNQAPANTACKWPIFDYLTELNCDEKTGYGYKTGLPCVFIKINNIFDYKPAGVQYPSNATYSTQCNTTNEVLSTNKDPLIYLTCNGIAPGDKANINSMTFNSPLGLNRCVAGVPFYFYPYNNVKYYMQPVVPVRLNLTKGASVAMECFAWAKGLVQDAKKGYGYVKFTVTVS